MSYIVIARYDRRSMIFWAQTLCIVAMLAKLFGYYSPLISRREYELMAYVMDGVCISADMLVLSSILKQTKCLSFRCWQECAVTLALFLHQNVRYMWHQAADIGGWPVPEFAYLVPLRHAMNYVYLGTLCMLVIARSAKEEI
jgi:hypothetical protein